MEAFSERVPPQDLVAEQSVLGACLIDKDVLAPVLRLLKPLDFYAEKHQDIFDAIQTLHGRREPVDLATVQSYLHTKERLDGIGGMFYLTTCINQVVTTANTGAYALIVRKKSDLRNLQRAARKIVDQCYHADDWEAMKSETVSEINRAVFGQASNRERQVGPALLEYMEEVANTIASGEESKDLIKTPFRVQDNIMPLARGETTVVVAASGVGKTTYEKALQYGVAKQSGVVKGYSLEMSEKQLFQKYWGLIARINTMAIRKGRLSQDELNHSLERVSTILNLPWYFEPHPRMKWTDIKVDAMAFAARHGKVDLITVDYIQILGDPPPKDGRRDSQLGWIVEDAKALAVDLNCHVLFLAQQKINKTKPVGENEDVAESRDIVRAADNVLFLTRPTEYDREASIPLTVKDPETNQWITKQILCGAVDPLDTGRLLFENVMLGYQGKQRMGGKAPIPYYFEPETGIVCDLARPYPWDNPKRLPRKQEVPD